MNFLDVLKTVGETAYQAQTGGLQISLKTNLGPELKIWDGKSKDGRSLAQLLGIKGAFIVRDRVGKVIMIHGEVPKTNILLSAAYLAGASYIAYLIWRGVRRKK